MLPAAEEDHARFHEYLLRRNHELYGVAFEIGEEDGIFLAGQLDARSLTDDELDRILGTVYVTVERCFPQAVRIGFASRLARASDPPPPADASSD
ncbi:MAG: YbjN domain-containing protein [Actinomycetota bacterium]